MRSAVAGSQPTTHPKCDAKEHEQHPIIDPRYYALYAATAKDIYELRPGGEQARFLATLALDFGGFVDPGTAIQALACLALRDRVAALKQTEAAILAGRDELTARVATLEPLEGALSSERQRREAAEAQVTRLHSQVTAKDAELVAERERVARLWGEIDDTHPDDAPARDAKPRRVKVDGETGIYLTSSGLYEIGFKDRVGGTQRWEVVGDDLEQARAIRAERIAEAKATVAA